MSRPTEAEEEFYRELSLKAAADARRPYALAQKANLTRLEQLVKDADKRAATSGDGLYWRGVGDGLRRAINVLEGRG